MADYQIVAGDRGKVINVDTSFGVPVPVPAVSPPHTPRVVANPMESR